MSTLKDQQPMPQSSGFTLLEVLVALVILGLAAAFLTATISDSVGRAERIDTEDRAAALADSILDQIGTDIPVKIGVTQGQAGNLLWQVSVFPYSGPASAFPLDQVNLVIFNASNHVIGQWQTLRDGAQ